MRTARCSKSGSSAGARAAAPPQGRRDRGPWSRTSRCRPAESRPRTSSRSRADSATCTDVNASIAAIDASAPARSATARAVRRRSLRTAQAASFARSSAALTASSSALSRPHLPGVERVLGAREELGEHARRGARCRARRLDRRAARARRAPRAARRRRDSIADAASASPRHVAGPSARVRAERVVERGDEQRRDLGRHSGRTRCRTTPMIPHMPEPSSRSRATGSVAKGIGVVFVTAARALDLGDEAVRDELGALDARCLDHDPDDRLGARRAHEHATVGLRAPRRSSATPARSCSSCVERGAVADGHVAQDLREASASRRRAATASARCRARRRAGARPVRAPSPVVAWSVKITWPDCSPPRARCAALELVEHVAVTDAAPRRTRSRGSRGTAADRGSTSRSRPRRRLGAGRARCRSSAQTAMIWSPSTIPPRSSTAIDAVAVAVEREAGTRPARHDRLLQPARVGRAAAWLMLVPSGAGVDHLDVGAELP